MNLSLGWAHRWVSNLSLGWAQRGTTEDSIRRTKRSSLGWATRLGSKLVVGLGTRWVGHTRMGYNMVNGTHLRTGHCLMDLRQFLA